MAGRGIAESLTIYWALDTVLAGAGDPVTLDSYTIASGVMLRNGDSINFEYYGKAADTEDGSFLLTLGAETVFSKSSITMVSGEGFVITGKIARVDSATLKVFTYYSGGNTFQTDCVTISEFPVETSAALTLVADGTEAGALQLFGAFITFLQAPS